MLPQERLSFGSIPEPGFQIQPAKRSGILFRRYSFDRKGYAETRFDTRMGRFRNLADDLTLQFDFVLLGLEAFVAPFPNNFLVCKHLDSLSYYTLFAVGFVSVPEGFHPLYQDLPRRGFRQFRELLLEIRRAPEHIGDSRCA